MNAVSLMFHDVYASDPRESGFESPAADRYKLTATAFERHLAGLATILAAPPLLASALQVQGEGGESVLLTFDDGGVSYYTIASERLEARGWRGHCFITTDRIGEPGFLSARQIRELDERGHLIGTHSVSHPTRFRALSFPRQQSEWADSRMRLEDLLGHAVIAGSVPGGFFSPEVARAATAAGLTMLFTSEPTTRVRTIGGCLVIGRFALRRTDRSDMCRRLVQSPWARRAVWADWTAKAMVKPLLGGSYPRVAQSLLQAIRHAE